MTKTYGYVRVSSVEQNEIRQLLALEKLGLKKRNIFVDKKITYNKFRKLKKE